MIALCAAFAALFLAAAGPALAAPKPTPARALHERLLTLDTHLDTPALLLNPDWDIMARHSYDEDYSQVDFPRLVEGGLDGGFWVIYTAQGPRAPEGYAAARDHALRTAMRIREMVAAHPKAFTLAFTAADAEAIHKTGRRIVYQSMENAYPLGRDVTLLKTFHTFGVRMVSPVHFSNNDFADSATDPKGAEWGGLSPLGETLIAEANRLGMIVDASHASDAAFDDMLALSKTPIILSHSGVRALYDHPRNLDDARLKALAAKGGVIQMNSLSAYLIPTPPNPERRAALTALRAQERAADVTLQQRQAFLTARRRIDKQFPEPRATFDDFMAHVLYALKLLGPDHVGIGADWDGGGGVVGMGDVAAFPKITARLLEAGYTEKDIAKIWGGNVLRLLEAAEAYKAQAPEPAQGGG